MPIDPVTGYLITQLGGALLSGLFGGGGSDQERNSFSGTAADPVRMLSNANTFANNFGRILADRAAQPITLRGATVQQPGAYTGGGMPMPIGLVATDPAIKDPSLLTLAGNPLFAHLFDGMTGGYVGLPNSDVGNSTPLATGGGSLTGGETVTPWADQARDPDGPLGPDAPMGDALRDFYLPNFNPNSPQNPQGTTDGLEPTRGNAAEARGPRRRSDANDGEYGQLVRANDLQDGGDDLSRGLGAVNLLLEAYGMPTRME